jgi:hypothetical protein
MAENKYLKAMEQAKAHIKTPVETSESEPPQPKATRIGRPPGKRSNPDWEQTTLFVRKETKRAAMRRLMDDGSGQDLSEVIEQLLAKWAKAS